MDHSSLDNFSTLDPRKQELLEARFLGNRFQPLNHTIPQHHHENSNLSGGSASDRDDQNILLQQTPDKKGPPSSERKRKRKATNDSNDAATLGKTNRTTDTNGRKINEYFKSQSPNRVGPAIGPKSPSPQGFAPRSHSSGSNSLSPQSHSSDGYLARALHLNCKGAQTDLGQADLAAMTINMALVEQKDTKIEALVRQNEELQRQLTAQQKLLEKHKDTLSKCVTMTKALLVEKSLLEKKTTRQKCMENRLRLGQFVTQRQGATFVENWNDGWAFTDLLKTQERIVSNREDIEKKKKNFNQEETAVDRGEQK